jgi:hypothetical protein
VVCPDAEEVPHEPTKEEAKDALEARQADLDELTAAAGAPEEVEALTAAMAEAQKTYAAISRQALMDLKKTLTADQLREARCGPAPFPRARTPPRRRHWRPTAQSGVPELRREQ